MSNANLVALQNAINTNTLTPSMQALLSDALGAIIPAFPEVDEIARGIPEAALELGSAWLAPLFAIGGGQGGIVFPLLTATFVDPQDSTGQATDAGPGSSAQPLLTVAELNRRMGQAPLTTGAIYTITFLSNMTAPDEPLNTNQVRGQDIELDFVGTPAVLHTGVLTGATVPMDPTAAGGGQATVLADTTLGAGGWSAFVAHVLRVTSGARAGTSLWISHTTPSITTATGSAPFDDTGDLVAGPQSGDPYEIVAGTAMKLGTISDVLMTGSPTITFTDIETISLASSAGYVATIAFIECTRVQQNVFVNGTAGVSLLNSWSGPNVSGQVLFFTGGVWAATFAGQIVTTMNVDAHLLVNSTLRVATFGNGVISLGVNLGIQFQDCPGFALEVASGVNLAIGSARVWGKNNSTTGNPTVLVDAGGSLSIAVPTVTGNGDDWALSGSGPASPYDSSIHAYAAPIAGPHTWAQLTTAIGSGGFGNGAHNVQFNSHLTAGVQ